MELLPENVGCPQCGSTSGKRWRSYSGVELCTDCEWDYFAELNGRKLLDAAQQARQTKILPSASVTAASIRHKSLGTKPAKRTSVRLGVGGVDALGKVLGLRSKPRPEDDIRCKVKWIETMEKLVTPGFNSLCLLCSRIFYGAHLDRCTRCGGLCQQVSDHDLGLMGRHGQRLVEQER